MARSRVTPGRTPLRGVLIASLLGALFVLPATAWAGDPGTVAYPNNPSGTPAANDGGKPVAPSAKVCATPGCPDVPGPGMAKAGDTNGKDQKAGIRTPTAAYPESPVKTPATDTGGQAPPY